MNYYYSFFAFIIIILLSHELYLRLRSLKFVTVRVEDKDGSTRFVTFRVGKDPEAEALIKSIKLNQKIN